MARTQTAHLTPQPAIGALLQYWRKVRNMSQLTLANEASVSPRHVCFLETGRAKPSRDMVLHLADALSVPLRDRNALLTAAGYAPVYRQTSIDAPELAPVRAAIDAILAQQEPYPAVVMNRNWDIVASNRAAERFFQKVLGGRTPPGAGNVLRLMFHPEGLRPSVINWEVVARALVQRLHREAVGGVLDESARALLNELLEYPGVSADLRAMDASVALLPVLPVSFQCGESRFDFFSAVTVLGTPQDVTLQELRIEAFFPLNAATADAARALAAQD